MVEVRTCLHVSSKWPVQDQPPVVWYDAIHPLNLHRIYILTTTFCLSPYLGSVEDALWLKGVWGQAQDVQRGAGTLAGGTYRP
jgi:hypothetical protein